MIVTVLPFSCLTPFKAASGFGCHDHLLGHRGRAGGYMYVDVYVYVYVYAYVYVYVCMCIYIYIYVCMRICMYIYIYIYTYVCSLRPWCWLHPGAFSWSSFSCIFRCSIRRLRKLGRTSGFVEARFKLTLRC